MKIHEEILQAVIRICRQRGKWQFRPLEIVLALPHLNPGTVRTHIISRCCVNAPKNHPHKWDYFNRVGRGSYELRRAYRKRLRAVAEPVVSYASSPTSQRETVHAVVSRTEDWYTAECLEVAVVTQGRTLDETVENLQEALSLHLQGESAESLGLVASPRLSVLYEPRPLSN